MSIGFGFSFGDFIAAIDLVATAVDAFRECGNSSSEFRGIVRQFGSLEDTLTRVKKLELDDTQRAEGIGSQKAASGCQITIDGFWNKVQKYQLPLRDGGSSSRLKDGWMKIKWELCKSDDVKSGLVQGKRILEITTGVMKTNLKIFQIVLETHHVITQITGQVDRQQPVYLIDTLGRHTLFHLEFIRSREAFVSVLRMKFDNIGQAAYKIEHGDFAIQHSATKHDVQLTNDWDMCLSPGQRVEINMIFRNYEVSNNCPRCEAVCENHKDEDSECPKCGMSFRIFTEASHRANKVNFQVPQITEGTSNIQKGPDHKLADRDTNEDLRLFRRVRIRCSLRIESSNNMPETDGPRELLEPPINESPTEERVTEEERLSCIIRVRKILLEEDYY
ncbi:hypothetical protein NHQ30_011561 [Ciborinia camelliae]|nr:hypothetical protein NHQ30_011561 [Ciborinia camelliae]